MPLNFITGNQAIDARIANYNQLEIARAAPADLLTELDHIEGWIKNNVAGRRAMTFMAEISRETNKVRAAMAPPLQIQPPPQAQPPPQPAPQLAPRLSPPRPARLALQPQLQAVQKIPPPLPPRTKPSALAVPPTIVIPAAASGPANKFAFFISQFKKGADLLYGRSGKEFRDKYVLALSPDCWDKYRTDETNLRMQPDDDMDFVIIDTYNNAFLGTEVFSTAMVMAQGGREKKADRRKAIKPITDFAEKSEQSRTYLGKLPDERGEVKSFREFLENETSYDIGAVSSPDGLQMRYGRACKAGMAFAVFKRNGRIHFALDGIDSKSVLDDVAVARDKRRITGKELRWVFRHREVPEVKSEVLFWLDGAKTRPLWELDPGPWQKYEEQVRSRPSASKGVDKALGRIVQ